ncbi:lactonase family protein [Adlercreutzia sp. ZJ141]|uniref:lactonase family protein n=1 Tax=Adlercreutzia sp. ZJ141 TaxID=2709406 RepID=UPI0013ED7F13|nr:beta-propeller fold lactonase family protein [Adlercreutzia sp. ZJ141]
MGRDDGTVTPAAKSVPKRSDAARSIDKKGYGLLVSGYSDMPDSPGMHLFRVRDGGRTIESRGSLAGVQSPSFSIIEKPYVYAASESSECGRLAAYIIEQDNAGEEGKTPVVSISLINTAEVDGEEATCYVLKHPTRGCLYGANYQSGSLMSCRIRPDGSLDKALPVVKHYGHGQRRDFDEPNFDRQLAAHVHSLSFVPGTELLAAVDLGLDCIVIYELGENGEITSSKGEPMVSRWIDSRYHASHPSDFQTSRAYGCEAVQENTNQEDAESTTALFETVPSAIVEAPLGSGPRILAYHPTKPFAAVICELSCEVILYRIGTDKRTWDAVVVYDLITGAQDAVEGAHETSTVPSLAAHLQFTPDGSYLYASTRGVDTITAFRFDAENCRLERIECYWTGGAEPRHFAISPDGAFMAVANQLTSNVVIFAIGKNGTLEWVNDFKCPSPSCVVWH